MIEWVPRSQLDAPAIVQGQVTTSWRVLSQQVRALAQDFITAGIAPGTRVHLPTGALQQQIPILLAVVHARGVCVLTHAQLPREQALEWAAQAGATHAVDIDAKVHEISKRSRTPPNAAAKEFESATERELDVVFSSGSTRAPAAIVHTAKGHAASAAAVCRAVEFGPGSAWALDLPISHVGGLCILLRACHSGGALVAPDAELASLNPACTHVSAVPTQLHRALHDDKLRRAWSRLKRVLVGGAAVPPALARRVQESELGVGVRASYGMSEMTSTIAISDAGDVGGALRVLPHVEVKVHAGEFLLRGPSCAGEHDVDGWLKTGDRGTLIRERGAIFLDVTGRAGRMFISGGENVSPARVEAALLDAGARAACVVAAAHPEWGEVGVAFIAGDVDIMEVTRRASLKLAAFEKPRLTLAWPVTMSETKPKFDELRRLAGKALG